MRLCRIVVTTAAQRSVRSYIHGGKQKKHARLYSTLTLAIIFTTTVINLVSFLSQMYTACDHSKLENVANANALQLKMLRPPDTMARQSFSALITTPMPSLKSLNLSVAVL